MRSACFRPATALGLSGALAWILCSACVNVDALGAGGPLRFDGGAATNEAGLSDAGAEVSVDAEVDADTCPGTGGPRGVRAGGFCIDATEVTSAHYAAFLAAVAEGAPVERPPYCSWNAVLVPSSTGSCAGAYDPALRPDHPVVCVDWCDAHAFCRWAGKRLCTSNQWFAACSQGGTKAYPYGNDFQPTACNGGSAGAVGLLPVATTPSCEGGFPGVFDLSGNAVETVDDCQAQAGADDKCLFRGGRFSDGESDLACAPDHIDTRDNVNPSHSFRCCSP